MASPTKNDRRALWDIRKAFLQAAEDMLAI